MGIIELNMAGYHYGEIFMSFSKRGCRTLCLVLFCKGVWGVGGGGGGEKPMLRQWHRLLTLELRYVWFVAMCYFALQCLFISITGIMCVSEPLESVITSGFRCFPHPGWWMWRGPGDLVEKHLGSLWGLAGKHNNRGLKGKTSTQARSHRVGDGRSGFLGARGPWRGVR